MAKALFRPWGWTFLAAATLACGPLASCSFVPGSVVLAVKQVDDRKTAPKEFKVLEDRDPQLRLGGGPGYRHP